MVLLVQKIFLSQFCEKVQSIALGKLQKMGWKIRSELRMPSERAHFELLNAF